MKPPPTAGGAFISGVTPQSTTAQLAGQVPKEARRVSKPESDGSPPETPWHDAQEFKVDPIPATAGFGNPISLKPGEKVPPSNTISRNTVTSNVTTDQESYEKGTGATPQGTTSGTSRGVLGFLPSTRQFIPESGIPMGASSGQDAGPTIQSAGVGSTTAALAAQVPKEPRGEPTVISDSQKDPTIQSAGVGSTTAALAAQVPKEPRGETTAVSDSQKDPTIQSAGVGSTTAALAAQVPKEPRGVPTVVSDSQKAVGADPEASGNAEAVREKSAVEKELESKIPEEPATSTNTGESDKSPSLECWDSITY